MYMYCNQCGAEISDNSKFCNECGYPVSEKGKVNFEFEQQLVVDVVEDIQKRLREIDDCKRPSSAKGDAAKSVFESFKATFREEVAASGLVRLNDSFEEEKITAKKALIQNYPLPTSPKELARFAKYINFEIESKTKSPDALTPVWKEKLKQVYLFAETEVGFSEAFEETKNGCKRNKRRERHAAIREYVELLAVPIVILFIFSLVSQRPILLFLSILAAGWEVFLVLYVRDLLEDMVDSIKEHSAKRQNIPRRVRSIAWHLLIPLLAALITSVVYQSMVLIILFSILFGMDAFFLFLFLCDVYEW